MDSITLFAFILICILYIAVVSFCAYCCSNNRADFWWEKQNKYKEMDELSKEEEESDKIYYNEL